MEGCLTVRMNEVPLPAAAWMTLRNIMLDEREAADWVIPFT